MAVRKTRPRTSQVPVRLFRLVRVPFYHHIPAQCGSACLADRCAAAADHFGDGPVLDQPRADHDRELLTNGASDA